MKKASDLARIAMMVALMSICAWIGVPVTVPFTMQTFAVFMAAALLGAKNATVAVLIYLLLGCAGLPVFSGMRGGIGMLFGATGGYMVGFVFITLIAGTVSRRFPGNYRRLFASMLLGTALCYACGTAWYALAYMSGGAGIAAALTACVFPFIIPDIIKMLLAIAVAKRLGKYI